MYIKDGLLRVREETDEERSRDRETPFQKDDHLPHVTLLLFLFPLFWFNQREREVIMRQRCRESSVVLSI